jgi:hypothetical protein
MTPVARRLRAISSAATVLRSRARIPQALVGTGRAADERLFGSTILLLGLSEPMRQAGARTPGRVCSGHRRGNVDDCDHVSPLRLNRAPTPTHPRAQDCDWANGQRVSIPRVPFRNDVF